MYHSGNDSMCRAFLGVSSQSNLMRLRFSAELFSAFLFALFVLVFIRRTAIKFHSVINKLVQGQWFTVRILVGEFWVKTLFHSKTSVRTRLWFHNHFAYEYLNSAEVPKAKENKSNAIPVERIVDHRSVRMLSIWLFFFHLGIIWFAEDHMRIGLSRHLKRNEMI